MDNKSIAAAILLVLVFLPSGVAEFVTKPTDREVVVGGSTYLNCSTKNGLKINWFRTKLGSGQEEGFIYRNDAFVDNQSFIDRFQVENTEANGVYNLVISNVKIVDAGFYRCQEETGSNGTAELIVLDSDPVCEPQLETLEIIGPNKCGIEPSELILSCTVRYHGNEAPILAWRKVSDDTPVSEGVTNKTIDNNRVVYNLTIRGNSSVMDGDSYFCSTKRSATLDGGCHSGKIEVKGTGVDCPTCVASEICEPYIKSYIAALICFSLIILPAVVCGTIFATWWYLTVYRPKKLSSSENPRSNNEALTEVGTAEEMIMLHGSARSTGECSNGPDVKAESLENQLAKLLERIERRDKTISELTQKDISNNTKIKSLQLESDQLQHKLKDLEQRLYPKENIHYVDKPVLAHMIELSENGKDIYEKHDEMSEMNKVKSEKNDGKSEKRNTTSEKNIKGKAINGITVLGKELFVVTKRSQEIAVYDSKTFKHERNMEIRGMTNPLDIASSKEANCLYIVGQLSEDDESKVTRIDSRAKVLHQWPTGGRKGRLSTYGSNAILCLSDKQLINEYSPEGELILTVRLSPAAKLNNPLHAIKVTSTHFVVSHGDFKDELHRVCVVDLDGEIIKECTKWKKSTDASRTKMKVPLCLLENNERSIIVADTDHKRILLLSSVLKYQRKLIEEDNSLERRPIGEDNNCLKDFPARLCFDDTQSRLFVAVNKWSDSKKEWKDGRIQIFNIK